ncbi:hypothetical protein [Amycolatopsis sp. WQ 127309]|uniref:hypothetical protein n=1 Tax=Amycolatopsis sp. WQ 127309 TaxID=2932773 RepID=UPI001FF2F46F|nr:hypothetical protein [Amycolatopsis sp. WQ 127309]UOZ08012.1 hypothetical protein MUY22_06960 [Amycolatopsis sp. WQ 127309]
MSELSPRLRDEIDDQVAEAFDAYLAERLAEPGPLRTAVRARWWVPAVAALLGVAATLLVCRGWS